MTYKLMTLALGATLMATPAGAGGLRDIDPQGPPAGYEICVNAQREMDICPIPGYTPKPILLPSLAEGEMYKRMHQDPAETRHQELIGQIKSLEDTIRIIDAERLMPR